MPINPTQNLMGKPENYFRFAILQCKQGIIIQIKHMNLYYYLFICLCILIALFHSRRPAEHTSEWEESVTRLCIGITGVGALRNLLFLDGFLRQNDP